MNKHLREIAGEADLSLMEYLLRKINDLEKLSGIKRTFLAVCPNSLAVIRAALKSAKRCNAPIKFAATLNQVDLDGGYTGLTFSEFVRTIRLQSRNLNVTSPVIIAIDHGGPWLKDIHRIERWPFRKTMAAIKKSFEAALIAGYDLIHVDPTIDITLDAGKTLNIELVVDRTIELIKHTENFRRTNNFPPVAYEVGTEEVHGGLADIATFKSFLSHLKQGLSNEGFPDVWPCFIVGKVGTDLHTTAFDPIIARQLTEIAIKYGSYIKGHYSDNVINPEEYPESGMGAANVGPEFTEMEYNALIELESLQNILASEGKIAKSVSIKKVLRDTVISSGRWKKWLQKNENPDNFLSLKPERQEWLIKTGCRYIWENPEVAYFRSKLFQNLELNGINPQQIVESAIEAAMDRYYYKFNLVGLNKLL